VIYERKCPKCNITLTHSNKYYRDYAEKDGTLCRSCSSKRYFAGKSKTTNGLRIWRHCPVCSDKIFYSRYDTLENAEKQKSKCKNCSRFAKGLKRSPRDELFWAKVEVRGPTDCWFWQGPTNSKTGYGQFPWLKPGKGPTNSRVKTFYVHRYMYEFVFGKLKSSDHIHHTCNNKTCTNPTHLIKVSAKEHGIYTSIARGGSVYELLKMGYDPRSDEECLDCGKVMSFKKPHLKLSKLKTGQYCFRCKIIRFREKNKSTDDNARPFSNSKFTYGEADKIRDEYAIMRDNGQKWGAFTKLANKYGVLTGTIHKIIKGETYVR